MRNILRKELKLSASLLSYFFIAFGFMFFLPGYPVLCSAFFVTLGIFQSFQNIAPTNDIVFSALLPIAKKDVVRGKFIFACFIELLAFLVMTLTVVLRMTVFADSPVYRSNALMNANPFSLGMALVIFGLFNLIFIGGFFKTAYRFGKPFIIYVICTFAVIFIAEALHHIPGLGALNSFGFDCLPLQLYLFGVCVLVFPALTFLSLRLSCRRFEATDL